jgi:UDP-2,3-diacylglucosamine pyrophosphatase LpxH
MGKLNRDADYFVISDAHVGCHNCMDVCNYKKLIPFLKEVLKDTQATLILNGDFFEYTKARKSRVMKKNQEIVNILNELEKQGRLIKIRGNHDEKTGVKKKIINNDILVFHGDSFENTSFLMPWFSHMVQSLVSFTERIFKMDINDILRKFIGYDRKGIRKKRMSRKAAEFLEKHPEYKAIIVGHSHTPDSSGAYYNTGCFVNGKSDYVEVIGKKIHLKSY